MKYMKTVLNFTEIEPSISEVAFIGRSNVGKSSVINAVCGQKQLAHTSQIPGKTRAINVFSCGSDRWLIDLPGYGYATGPAEERGRWPAMIEGYLTSRPMLRMVYMIVDAKVGPTKLDQEMVYWLSSKFVPFSIIANKADKISAVIHLERRKVVAAELGKLPENIFWVSAEKKTGIPELARAIVQQLDINDVKDI